MVITNTIFVKKKISGMRKDLGTRGMVAQTPQKWNCVVLDTVFDSRIGGTQSA